MYIRTRGTLTILPLALAALISGCDSDPTNPQTGDDRTYGAAQPLGNGTARTNVEFDGEDPFEIGVAISETAMESVGQNMVMLRLALPEDAPEPYTFAMLDWNPHGHEPDGIYNLPHFDFHFYITPEAEVDAIVPTDPNYATRANNLPAGALVPQFHAVLSAPGSPPATVAVPRSQTGMDAAANTLCGLGVSSVDSRFHRSSQCSSALSRVGHEGVEGLGIT